MRNNKTMNQLDTVFLDYVRRVTLIGGGASDVDLMRWVRQLPASVGISNYQCSHLVHLNKIIGITREKIGAVEDDGINNLTWDVGGSDYAQTWIKQLNGLNEEIDKSDPMMCLRTLFYDWKSKYELDYWEKPGLLSMPLKLFKRDEIESVNSMLNDLVNTVQTCDRENRFLCARRPGSGRWKALQKTLVSMKMSNDVFAGLKKDMRTALRDSRLGSKTDRTRAARQILVDRAIAHITPILDRRTTHSACKTRPRTL